MQPVTEPVLDVKLALDLYRRMLQLRQFEIKVQELYRNAQLPGFVHLYIGEEAVAAGVCARLKPEDRIYSTHRGHGHALAKGVPARDVMAELFAKAAGCSGGRGGSMHMYAPEYGFMGTNGVVGAGLTLSTGSALSSKLRKDGCVTVCFFGDGGSNSGSFHEALNFAAVWNLPAVFVCENNLYATEMALSRAAKNVEIATRAAAYLIPGVAVDGSDVFAVHSAAGEAIERARSGAGPTLIECKTYRFVGHHEGDPGTGYRPKEEIEFWKQRCPIKTLRERLLAGRIVEPPVFDRVERETERWVDDSVEYARACPEPSASSVLEHAVL